MELSTSDLIQLIGIMVAIITGITSISISIITLRQNSKIVKESNKAQIEIFPFKVYGDIYPKIKIQNFGQTTGVIIDVKTIPEMPIEQMVINPFEFYKDLSLAPNQSFTTTFCKSNSNKAEVPIEVFNVEITYKTLNKTVKSTFHINYKFLHGYTETHMPSKTVESSLDKINQSIQGLQQK